jgi:hypothetical protein
MRRWLLRGLAALLLGGACWLPVGARGQESTARAGAPPPEKTEPAPALPAVMALLFTLAVLLLVCTPGRSDRGASSRR